MDQASLIDRETPANIVLAKPRTSIQPRLCLFLGAEIPLTVPGNQINYRMRVTLTDGRQMTGQMLAFDKVNIFLSSST